MVPLVPGCVNRLTLGAASAARHFAATRAVKYDPGRKVIAEIDETVADASWDEQGITGRKRCRFTVDNKRAMACLHHVDFVLFVRLLRIDLLWLIEANFQGATLQQYAVVSLRRFPDRRQRIVYSRPDIHIEAHGTAVSWMRQSLLE